MRGWRRRPDVDGRVEREDREVGKTYLCPGCLPISICPTTVNPVGELVHKPPPDEPLFFAAAFPGGLYGDRGFGFLLGQLVHHRSGASGS